MPTGEYHGRLAFGEDGFHVDPDGNRVVTDDGGKTWRYAKKDDPSHLERYHERFVPFDSTANHMADLALEHGRERAEEIMREEHPHHFSEPVPGGLIHHPDDEAETMTSHTEAKS